MALNTMEALLVEQMQDVYYAEKQLVKALPKMIHAATSVPLKDALTAHLAETEKHVDRMEEVLTSMGEAPRGKKCKGMEGILEEGSEMLDTVEMPALDGRALLRLRRHAKRLKHLLQPRHVFFGLGSMGGESLAEFRCAGRLGHLGKRLHQLFLGIVNVLQLVHEQVVHRLDVFGKQSHWFNPGWGNGRSWAILSRSVAVIR